MTKSFDCIVLGVGGFGSGALYHLARRGARVLGIEQFGVAHDRGSSHGETRIIRKAYFEHPDYVPLLLSAYELWHGLEQEVGRQLYFPVGLMLAGPADGEAISGARQSARLHGLAIEEIPHTEAEARFPGFRIPDESSIVMEHEAGYLDVEECVRAHIRGAVNYGAILQTDEPVLNWRCGGATVHVRTATETYEAKTLIVTAGAWAATLLKNIAMPLQVVRKVVYWHAADSTVYDASQGTPAFYFETPTGAFYGFPCIDGKTVKVAEHSGGVPVSDPLTLDRNSHPEDEDPVRKFVQQTLPQLQLEPVRHSVCMYTNSPDGHFIVDRHPDHPNVFVAAGFSGHGFKFTSVLGEALAELALNGVTHHPIEFLGRSRDTLRQ